MDRSETLKSKIITYRNSLVGENLDKNIKPAWHTTKGYGRVIQAVPIGAVPPAG